MYRYFFGLRVTRFGPGPDPRFLCVQYSNGIPRLINLICEHSTISAYVEQVKPISARIVESVSIKLDLDQQPFLISNGALSKVTNQTMPTALSSAANFRAESTDSAKDIEL